MLGAGGPQDADPAALGAAIALGHWGLSHLTRQQCWQQGGEETWPLAALAGEEPSEWKLPGPRRCQGSCAQTPCC